jgi:hypothetical protein
MPSSAVRTFTDPDDYAASMRRGTVELTVTGCGEFSAKLTRVDLHHLWMQRFSENLPRIADAINIARGRTYITFRTRPGPSLLQSGVELGPLSVMRHSPDHDYYQRSTGSADFATMSLPVDDCASIAEALAGVDLTLLHDPLLITRPPDNMARLQRLHAAAAHLAQDAPEIIANADAARGIEQALSRP